jgi:hypothetical protein
VWYVNISAGDICARPALEQSGYSAADNEQCILYSLLSFPCILPCLVKQSSKENKNKKL